MKLPMKLRKTARSLMITFASFAFFSMNAMNDNGLIKKPSNNNSNKTEKIIDVKKVEKTTKLRFLLPNKNSISIAKKIIIKKPPRNRPAFLDKFTSQDVFAALNNINHNDKNNKILIECKFCKRSYKGGGIVHHLIRHFDKRDRALYCTMTKTNIILNAEGKKQLVGNGNQKNNVSLKSNIVLKTAEALIALSEKKENLV